VLISLIKPQFEAGRKAINKNGLVRDKKIHETVIMTVIEAAASHRLYCEAVALSPITGGDGNIEYLGKFVFQSDTPSGALPTRDEIHKVVFGVNT